MGKKKVTRKVLLGILMGNLLMPVGEAANTYDKQITGNYAIDSQENYFSGVVTERVTGDDKDLIYNFLNGDVVSARVDNWRENEAVRVSTVEIDSDKIVSIFGHGATGMTLSTSATGGNVEGDFSASSSAYAYGIVNSGTNALDGTTNILVDATGGVGFSDASALSTGIFNDGTSSLNGITNISVNALGGTSGTTAFGDALAIGITNSQMNILNGTTNIIVNATGGVVVDGMDFTFASASTFGIGNTGTSILNGTTNIVVAATGGVARDGNASVASTGMGSSGTSILNGTTNIVVEATGGVGKDGSALASGIRNDYGTVIANENSRIVIDVKALGGTEILPSGAGKARGSATVYGIYATNLAEIKGDLIITTQAELGADSNLTGGTALAYALYTDWGGRLLVNQEGGKTVQLVGDLATDSNEAGNEIKVKLDNSNSFLTGMIMNASGVIELELSEGGSWRPSGDGEISSDFGSEGNLKFGNGGVLDLAYWNNRNAVTARNLNVDSQYRTLSVTGRTTFSDGGVIRINSDVEKGLADKVIFNHATGSGTQYVQVAYDPSYLKGGVIDYISGNGPVVLELAGDSDANITVVGQESFMDNPLNQYKITPTIVWNEITQQAILGKTVVQKNGISQSAMALSDAQVGLSNAFKVQGNNMMRRMGDLRLNPEAENGIWARVYTGKLESKSAYGRKFDQNYTGTEFGYDREFKVSSGKIYAGVLGSYLTSDLSYNNGNGDLKSYGMGLYGSWLSDKGHYVDMVFLGAKMKKAYRLRDIGGTQVTGDYDTWSYGFSAEYGYHKELKNQWFVEPQIEVSFGHVGSGNHTSSNGLDIHQSSRHTSTGRLGILLGKDFDKGSEKKGNLYVRTSVVKDFSDKGSLRGTYQGMTEELSVADCGATSIELNVGGNVKLSKKANGYLELTKSFGGDVKTKWQVNGGVRILF